VSSADSGQQVDRPGRRQFLRRGLIGGGLLVVAGVVPFAFRSTRMRHPHGPLRLLSPAEYAVLAAAVARIVPGDSAGPAWPTAEALDCAGKIDALLARVHPDMGNDFRRLLRLLESSAFGALQAGSPRPFTRAAPAEQDARLEGWRTSRLDLLRSGYEALKRLAHASYYASPETYALVGYPGPPQVPQPPEVP
jgi:Gluconate 2-dehydrogenase subunit 3